VNRTSYSLTLYVPREYATVEAQYYDERGNRFRLNGRGDTIVVGLHGLSSGEILNILSGMEVGFSTAGELQDMFGQNHRKRTYVRVLYSGWLAAKTSEELNWPRPFWPGTVASPWYEIGSAGGGVRVRLAESLPLPPVSLRKGWRLVEEGLGEPWRARLVLAGSGPPRPIRELGDLRGAVRIEGAGQALSYARLRTSPFSHFFFRKEPIVESFYLDRQFPPSVRKVAEGYRVRRQVVRYGRAMGEGDVLTLTETVGRDGSYKAEASPAPADKWLVQSSLLYF
jgi:hypothetical protein